MPGGLVHHVRNRSVAGLPLFRKEADYLAPAHETSRSLPILAASLRCVELGKGG
jgi:hypothetical protein